MRYGCRRVRGWSQCSGRLTLWDWAHFTGLIVNRALGERNPAVGGFENFDTLIENLGKKIPEGIKTGNACRLASAKRLNTTTILILPRTS